MARKRLAFKASVVEVVVQFEFPLLTQSGLQNFPQQMPGMERSVESVC
jgi:hypothetical protein